MRAVLAIVLAVAFFASTSAFALTDEETKSFCAEISKGTKDTRDQLPIEIDYVTTLVGMPVLYANGKCTITYLYVLKERKYAAAVSEQLGGVHVPILFTQNMRDVLANYFINESPKNFKDLAAFKEIDVIYNIRFDEGINKPIVVKLPKR